MRLNFLCLSIAFISCLQGAAFAASGVFLKLDRYLHRVFVDDAGLVQWHIGTGEIESSINPWITVTLSESEQTRFHKFLFKGVFGEKLDLATVSNWEAGQLKRLIMDGLATKQNIGQVLKLQNVSGIQAAGLIQLFQSIEGTESTYLNRKGDIYLRAATLATAGDPTRQDRLSHDAWNIIFADAKSYWQNGRHDTAAALDSIIRKHIKALYDGFGRTLSEGGEPVNIVIRALLQAIAGDTKTLEGSITVARETVPMKVVMTYFGLHLQADGNFYVFESPADRFNRRTEEITSYTDKLRNHKDFKDAVKKKTLLLFHRRIRHRTSFPRYQNLILTQPFHRSRASGQGAVRSATGPSRSFNVCFTIKTGPGQNCFRNSDGFDYLLFRDFKKKMVEDGLPELVGLAPLLER